MAGCTNANLNAILTSILNTSSDKLAEDEKILIKFLSSQDEPAILSQKVMLINKLIKEEKIHDNSEDILNNFDMCLNNNDFNKGCDRHLRHLIQEMRLDVLLLIMDCVAAAAPAAPTAILDETNAGNGEKLLKILINSNLKVKKFVATFEENTTYRTNADIGDSQIQDSPIPADPGNNIQAVKPNAVALAVADADANSFFTNTDNSLTIYNLYNTNNAGALTIDEYHKNRIKRYAVAPAPAPAPAPVDENVPYYNLLKGIVKVIEIGANPASFSMTLKIFVYTILYILLRKYYNIDHNGNKNVRRYYYAITNGSVMKCAPMSVKTQMQSYDLSIGGYNNKNGNIDYHLCKCNFKQSFKKVSAKSSREAAKMVAMKVLKGNKKSATFSLKRMVGKKEKCYDYEASLDKKGKIVIKNQ